MNYQISQFLPQNSSGQKVFVWDSYVLPECDIQSNYTIKSNDCLKIAGSYKTIFFRNMLWFEA